MDPNTLNQIVGLVYVQKFRSETPFSNYDRLTPDEPIWAWRVAKRLLSTLIHALKARQNASTRSSFADGTSMTATAR